MSYYRGDYYRGDYYQGDPFVHKSLGKLVKGVVSVGTSLLPGPVGALARKAVAILTPAAKVAGAAAAAGTAVTVAREASRVVVGGAPPPGQIATPGVRGVVERLLPGGRTGYEECPRGYHVATSGDKCVRNRRMNVTNVRALRRAGRRVRGFLKIARKLGAVPLSSGGKRMYKTTRRGKKACGCA